MAPPTAKHPPTTHTNLRRRTCVRDENEDEVHYGESALVVPVRRGQELYVLKMRQPGRAVASEAIALAAWAGQGAVELIDADPAFGALLLERLDPRRSLFGLALGDAAQVAGALLARLAQVPASTDIPRLGELGRALAASLAPRNALLGLPVPSRIVDAAAGLARELSADAADCLVHADLHYGNVLAGAREPWLAIDPRAVAGDAEYAVPELLWTRLDDVDATGGLEWLLAVGVGSANLDMQSARGWSIARCVDYWLWGVEHGLTEDPKRCNHIVEELRRTAT